MGSTILLAFHTSEGQTARIAERIGAVLRERGHRVDLHPVEAAPAPDAYEAAIAGDSVHVGHHSPEMVQYLETHATVLNAMPCALFQVSLTSANPDAEHTATAHALVQELLDRTGFDPDAVGLFAGALVYTQYGWVKRHMVRAVVKRQGGDVDMSRDYEYTDWEAVTRFAEDFDGIVRAGTTDDA